MLYEDRENERDLQPVAYKSFADLFGKEKDLEDLLAKQLGTLYAEESQLMPIFQERQRQEEPDLCALDREGPLVIFELKRCCVLEDAVLQVMRHAQRFGGASYEELNRKYHAYRKDASEVRGLSAAELKRLLGKNFYFASTAKVPFLTAEESETLVAELKRLYQQE